MAKREEGVAEMTTQAVQQFVAEQLKLGGVILSKLEAGYEVVVETSRFVYCIKPTVEAGERAYLINSGAPSPQGEKICTAIDAHYPLLKHNISDWIGKGMRMILRYRNGVTILTGETLAASVEGGGFKYELWQ